MKTFDKIDRNEPENIPQELCAKFDTALYYMFRGENGLDYHALDMTKLLRDDSRIEEDFIIFHDEQGKSLIHSTYWGDIFLRVNLDKPYKLENIKYEQRHYHMNDLYINAEDVSPATKRARPVKTSIDEVIDKLEIFFKPEYITELREKFSQRKDYNIHK